MLDAETILVATEEVLRRHGPSKATVVDVARALGVSHAAVYRHFASKAALREAVTRRFVGRTLPALEAIAADAALAPPQRLRAWISAMFAAKRAAAGRDPELFATYRALAGESSTVAAEHVAALLSQLERMVADGVATGDFAATDAAAAARAIFWATAAFHDPAHAAEWDRPGREAVLADVCTLVVNGLR
ncbi:TetR family transcriptional regulator [Dactylosporangium sp. McL0621]|uniref:TetR family transcriptional regulator n=1 Tax=Dactylosporangium sp. McL0621 TaxID=3415678 RepID=UPI003CF75721